MGDPHTADDDDWVSSSSAVASPTPEPDDDEEDAIIYVNQNQNTNQRSNAHDQLPATPRRLNHRLPNQRHSPSQVIGHVPDVSLVPEGGPHPTNATPQRHQHNVPTESSHIHFTEPRHQTETLRYQNGAPHHVSPPPPVPAAADADLHVQPGTSVIRLTAPPPVPEQSTTTEPHLNGKMSDRQRPDEQPNGNRRTSATLQQDQIDISASSSQIVGVHSKIRPAVPGNGDTSDHAPQGDIGRTSQQRGFGAVANPALGQRKDDALPPMSTLVSATPEADTNSKPAASRIRPSALRRDTTPTAVSRFPVAIDTPPRASTPPASVTHDEMVVNHYKRHSIHSTGGHARPLSLFQPTSSGKRLSLTSRPSSAYHSHGQIHGKNNPLALLIRLNPGSTLAAPPVVSPSYDSGDRDSDSAYMAMSPTRSRSLRKRASASSLNSVATAPVITTSATASGSSASPTSALATSSSAMLKHLSTSAHSDTRQETLRPDDRPLFVGQFYPTNGALPGQTGKRRERSIGQKMAGSLEWRSHETAMKHRGLMAESFNRISAARAASVVSRRR
jgi:hypothetical protein